jgi:AraC-like DNA-binding protein
MMAIKMDAEFLGRPVDCVPSAGHALRCAVAEERSIMEALHSIVSKRLGDDLVPVHVARMLGLSETELRNVVNRVTGFPFRVWVQTLRLEQARTWLASECETRSQAGLARALGFTSSSAFGRAYRARFGETVAETRMRAVRLAELLSALGGDQCLPRRGVAVREFRGRGLAIGI